jgi:serine/threonine protein kinase
MSLSSYKLKRTCFCRLAYLHEDLEPSVLHGCLKSSNILLDHQWNPKITDFGLAKLFDPEWSHLIMETLGSVSLLGEFFIFLNIKTHEL